MAQTLTFELFSSVACLYAAYSFGMSNTWIIIKERGTLHAINSGFYSTFYIGSQDNACWLTAAISFCAHFSLLIDNLAIVGGRTVGQKTDFYTEH